MSNLTRYWHRKKFAISEFITKIAVTDTMTGGSSDRNRIIAWLAAMTTTESALETELGRVSTEWGAVNDRGAIAKPKRERRSARLVDMVQKAAKVTQNRKGYLVSVADLPAGGGSPVTPYKNAVRDASEAATEFLWAAKFGSATMEIGQIDTAITKLLAANPAPSPDPNAFVRDEIERLQKSIQEFMSNPGRGEGSGYWPSSFITSSSSSS